MTRTEWTRKIARMVLGDILGLVALLSLAMILQILWHAHGFSGQTVLGCVIFALCFALSATATAVAAGWIELPPWRKGHG